MTEPRLPTLPDGLATMGDVAAASRLGEWIYDVARTCGEPALDRVLTSEWPSSKARRLLIAEGAIERARNEARQLASETSFQAARERGEWGV